jgi:hypothetical protein
MNRLDIRLQALHWLLAATKPWLFQGLNSAQPFPNEDHVDWKVVGDQAYVHNIEPLLHWMVLNTDINANIPGWLKQNWERAYFGNFLRNEEYFETLKALLAECEKEGIPVIVLKGPALMGRIYRDPALRTLSDLDILCSQNKLQRIVNIAHRMGYAIMNDGDDPAAAHHVAMVQTTSETILEFHFLPYEVIQNHARFMQLAWDRREWIEVGDFRCPVLSLEMELLFNVAHLVQHQFDVSLKHYLDIAALLVFFERQLDQDKIGTLLQDFGLEQAFSLTTEFLSTTLHLPQVSGAPRVNHEKSTQRDFDASLLDLLALLDEERLLDVRGVIWHFRMAFGNRVGFRNKIDYLMKTLLPFSDSSTDHGTRSPEDAFRYLLHQSHFYCRRLFATLTHLPTKRPQNKKHSLAEERAGAKNRITRQLQKISRQR